MNIKNISKEQLELEYLVNKKSSVEIAKLFRCSSTCIINKLKKFNIPTRDAGVPKNDLSGKKINSLLVIKQVKGKTTSWLCECDCGNSLETTTINLVGGQKSCWDCRNVSISRNRRKGYKGISGVYWSRMKLHAKERGIEFDLTIEFLWDLFIKQNSKCALSGVEIRFNDLRESINTTTASLDRINSKGNYTIDNVQWVHKHINNMKQAFTQEEFINYCNLVSEYNRIKKNELIESNN